MKKKVGRQIISEATVAAPEGRKDSISRKTTSKIAKKKSNKRKIQNSVKKQLRDHEKGEKNEITRDYVDMFSGNKLYKPKK